jgi:hypothetical protein
MNPIILSLLLGGVVLILTAYKGKTSLKAHTKYKQLVDEINELDTDIKGLLKFAVYQSITPLFFFKIAMFSLFSSKSSKNKSLISIKKFKKKDKDLYIKYCIESMKNYLTYAPHWTVVIFTAMIFVGFFIALFSSLDKLKQTILTPFELNLFSLDTKEHKQHIHG